MGPILFLIWKLTGSQESYETAYRCGAYIGVLTPISILLHLIPFVGAAVSVLLMTFFLVTASVAVHNIPSRKAWLEFGIIGGLLVFFSVSAEFAARRFVWEAAEYQKKAEGAAKTMQKQTEQFQEQAEEVSKAMEQQFHSQMRQA
jgi:type III secretory pathway component EscR